jgi:hypothetical protein
MPDPWKSGRAYRQDPGLVQSCSALPAAINFVLAFVRWWAGQTGARSRAHGGAAGAGRSAHCPRGLGACETTPQEPIQWTSICS